MKRFFIITVISVLLFQSCICIYANDTSKINEFSSKEELTNNELYITRLTFIDKLLDNKRIGYFTSTIYLETGFKDEKSDYLWGDSYTDALVKLQMARKNNIVKGYADGTFRGKEFITREDMYVMIYRFLKSDLMIEEIKTKIPSEDIKVLRNYNDYLEVSYYAKNAVSVLLQMDLYYLNNNLLEPKELVSVYEVDMLLDDIFDFCKDYID